MKEADFDVLKSEGWTVEIRQGTAHAVKGSYTIDVHVDPDSDDDWLAEARKNGKLVYDVSFGAPDIDETLSEILDELEL